MAASALPSALPADAAVTAGGVTLEDAGPYLAAHGVIGGTSRICATLGQHGCFCWLDGPPPQKWVVCQTTSDDVDGDIIERRSIFAITPGTARLVASIATAAIDTTGDLAESEWRTLRDSIDSRRDIVRVRMNLVDDGNRILVDGMSSSDCKARIQGFSKRTAEVCSGIGSYAWKGDRSTREGP